jgi:protein SCO1/2
MKTTLLKTTLSTIMAALLLQTVASSASETNTVTRTCCMRPLAPATFTDKSLYQVQSKWTTDAGKEIKFSDLAGKPQVVLMFFSHCTTACPVLVYNLRNIESSLTPAERDQIGITLVSFDSERDTPAVLSQYRKALNLSGDWTLLNGKPDDIRELAALLGVQYKQNADGQFAHSNAITLLNADGEIVFQQTGLDGSPEEMRSQIRQLLTVKK